MNLKDLKIKVIDIKIPSRPWRGPKIIPSTVRYYSFWYRVKRIYWITTNELRAWWFGTMYR